MILQAKASWSTADLDTWRLHSAVTTQYDLQPIPGPIPEAPTARTIDVHASSAVALLSQTRL
eukprot:COSAG01_NODE_6592_length_3588_cov_10.651476_3_plen_62_part_00